jgi:hypothetical protein
MQRMSAKTVDVANYPDGRFAVQFGVVALLFGKFDKIRTVAPPHGLLLKPSQAAVPNEAGVRVATMPPTPTTCPHGVRTLK